MCGLDLSKQGFIVPCTQGAQYGSYKTVCAAQLGDILAFYSFQCMESLTVAARCQASHAPGPIKTTCATQLGGTYRFIALGAWGA